MSSLHAWRWGRWRGRRRGRTCPPWHTDNSKWCNSSQSQVCLCVSSHCYWADHCVSLDCVWAVSDQVCSCTEYWLLIGQSDGTEEQLILPLDGHGCQLLHCYTLCSYPLLISLFSSSDPQDTPWQMLYSWGLSVSGIESLHTLSRHLEHMFTLLFYLISTPPLIL